MHKLPPQRWETVEPCEPWDRASPWAWVAGILIVALLTAGITAAGHISEDCKRVPGGQGQTLNVCVDKHGNISDGDR